MKKAITIVLTVVLVLALAACGSDAPSKSSAAASTNTASPVGVGASDPGSSALPKLFHDYFLVYARREKTFSWEEMSGALTADGYFVFEPVEGGFAVYDPDDENIWLGGNMTGDSDFYALSELGYFISMDYEGVVVEFIENGDKYYIITSITEQTEVGSLDEIIDHVLKGF